jgi:hypothetical protein
MGEKRIGLREVPFVVESVERSHGRTGLRFIDRNGRTLAW